MKSCREVVVREFGPIENHKLEEFPEPTPGPGDVLIDVHVVGVNFPDTLMIQGLYQTRPERPFVPGRDAAGVVAAVGENVTRFKPGDRVLAQVRWGAYAEQLAAPEERCFKVPDHVDFITAGAMGTVFPTAHVSLLIRAHYQTGETVLVNGAAGGIGLATVQITKAKGGTVIAGDISEEKRALATKYGADHTIDLAADDLRESLRQQVFAVTDGRGVDICMDPIGGDVFDASLRALAFEGRIVSVGYVAGRIPRGQGELLQRQEPDPYRHCARPLPPEAAGDGVGGDGRPVRAVPRRQGQARGDGGPPDQRIRDGLVHVRRGQDQGQDRPDHRRRELS